MAAAALKAAGNEQGWIRFGKKPKKLDDPLQVPGFGRWRTVIVYTRYDVVWPRRVVR